jgi:hypothetical protein
LGAIDNSQRITALGRKMAGLPLEPAQARVLLASFDNGCPRQVIDLVSMLGEADKLFINTSVARERAGEKRKKFWHREGDHLMLLNVLRAYEETPEKDRAEWCQTHFLSKRSFLHALEARKQLRQRCERLGLVWDVSCGEDETEPILSSLLAGLFENAALRQVDGTYRNVQTRMVTFLPSFGFFLCEFYMLTVICRRSKSIRRPLCMASLLLRSCTTNSYVAPLPFLSPCSFRVGLNHGGCRFSPRQLMPVPSPRFNPSGYRRLKSIINVNYETKGGDRGTYSLLFSFPCTLFYFTSVYHNTVALCFLPR